MPVSLLLTERKEGVALLTLHRPEALNALNLELAEALSATLKGLAPDPTVRAVLITGAGKAFCAGGDVREMQKNLGEKPSSFLTHLTLAFHAAILEIVRMPKPVVTAVNGVAAGGGLGLALAGDLTLASPRAQFYFAYPRIGLPLDGGASYFLPRAIGLKRALEIALRNQPIPAEEARALGLVSQILPEEGFLETAMPIAAALAQGPTSAWGAAKTLFHRGGTEGLEAQLEFERQAIIAASASHDYAEGVTALLEKREPKFSGS